MLHSNFTSLEPFPVLRIAFCVSLRKVDLEPYQRVWSYRAEVQFVFAIYNR